MRAINAGLDASLSETSAIVDAAPGNFDASRLAPIDATADTTRTALPDAADAATNAPDAGVVVAKGLILYLPFTQTSGTSVTDSSNYGNDARITCVQPCGNGLPLWLLRDGRRGIEMAYFQILKIGSTWGSGEVQAS